MSDARAPLKKQAAVEAALLIEDGMVVGLGTGSTAMFLIDALAERVREGLRIDAIATSEHSAEQARAGGMRVIGFDATQDIDIAIDGADEIEPIRLDLIKGLGGALLREKIVAAASRRFVVIADDSKLVVQARRAHACLPVEVVTFGWEATAKRLMEIGAHPQPREQRRPAVFFVTDGGNIILDCKFGAIADPAATERAIRDVVGVIETGLFIGRAGLAIVAGEGGIRRLPPGGTHDLADRR